MVQKIPISRLRTNDEGGKSMQKIKSFWGAVLIAAAASVFAGSIVNPERPVGPMQEAVQKILDDAVASGAQTAAQVCVYIDGKLVVDAWAGTYERRGKKKIDGDSLFPIFSTEKPVFVTAAHILHEQGKLDYDKRVCDYWSEFGCNGKEKMTMRHLLSHRTSLPIGSFSRTLSREKIADWDYMVKVVASQPVDKKYPPGTRSKYLPQVYGWALGEPLCRITGMKINELLRKLVLIPAGIEKDFYFSADDKAMPRIVTVYLTPQSDGKSGKSMESMNTELMRRACVPASYAVASARGIAKFYLSLTGQNGKKPLIRKETLDHATELSWWDKEPLTEDELTGKKFRMIFGLGYALWGSKGQPLGEIFGQGGLGGSEGYMDRKKNIIVSFTCSTKNYTLIDQIFRAVGFSTRHHKISKDNEKKSN